MWQALHYILLSSRETTTTTMKGVAAAVLFVAWSYCLNTGTLAESPPILPPPVVGPLVVTGAPSECKFPWIRNGVSFSTCANPDNDVNGPWCSTAVDASNNHITGNYVTCEACQDGERKVADDGCNICHCAGGMWGCTKMGCHQKAPRCQKNGGRCMWPKMQKKGKCNGARELNSEFKCRGKKKTCCIEDGAAILMKYNQGTMVKPRNI